MKEPGLLCTRNRVGQSHSSGYNFPREQSRAALGIRVYIAPLVSEILIYEYLRPIHAQSVR